MNVCGGREGGRKGKRENTNVYASHMYVNNNLLSLVIGIRTHTVRIAIFFSPKTFNNAAIDFCIMRRFDGMRRSFLGCKFDKGISLVFEYSYILNSAKRGKRFFYQLIRDTIRKTSTINGTIGRTTLVIHLLRTMKQTTFRF